MRCQIAVDMQGVRPPVPIFGAADKPAVPKFTGRVSSPDNEVQSPESFARAARACAWHGVTSGVAALGQFSLMLIPQLLLALGTSAG